MVFTEDLGHDCAEQEQSRFEYFYSLVEAFEEESTKR